MLTSLRVKNLAIIDNMEVEFEPGFNILSGETGAGKSILVQALKLLLGVRASSDLIRTGQEQASVEGVFSFNHGSRIGQILKEMGLDGEDDLIIRRLITKSGKSRILVNGAQATVQMLGQIGPYLVDLSSQHGHQILLDQKNHIRILDACGGLDREVLSYKGAYQRAQALRLEWLDLVERSKDRLERLDYIEFVVKELGHANISQDEEGELERERSRLANADKLSREIGVVIDGLYNSDSSITSNLSKMGRQIGELATIDDTLTGLTLELEEARISLEDLTHTLTSYVNKIEGDPARLESIESRLSVLQQLKKKYRKTLPELVKYQEKLKVEIETLRNCDERAGELEDKLKEALVQLAKKAKELSRKRADVATGVDGIIDSELHLLGMERARFCTSVIPKKLSDDTEQIWASLQEDGIDEVEFRISTNPGEDLKPLIRVASGGELSRIMLALKRVMTQMQDPGGQFADTYVFDEVDAGIGGRVAEIVGQRLKDVSKSNQVICVTHLPQIACQADHHFLVIKKMEESHTTTAIKRLSKVERMDEIARMLGGAKVTQKTKAYAKELIVSGG